MLFCLLCFSIKLFLGLSFLHLLPDTLREFKTCKTLAQLQGKYPLGELIICLGMIFVLSAEKFASIFQVKRQIQRNKCDGGENCCKEQCPVQGLFTSSNLNCLKLFSKKLILVEFLQNSICKLKCFIIYILQRIKHHY